jgi:hypothetical protein
MAWRMTLRSTVDDVSMTPRESPDALEGIVGKSMMGGGRDRQ